VGVEVARRYPREVVLSALAYIKEHLHKTEAVGLTAVTVLGACDHGGSGLGYQAPSLIAGGPAPLLATWMLPNFGWQAISVYIIACAFLTGAAVVLLPDRSRDQVPASLALARAAGR
jgi:hypothetical protein